MLKIGKRTIKTCIALLLCLVIYIILMLIEKIFSIDNNAISYAPTAWYTPFFAGIATIYAMHQSSEASKNQAKIRSIGSIIGGYFGAIIIFIFEAIYLAIAKADSIDLISNTLTYKTMLFLVSSLGILILIPITIKIKKQTATFISCLTYLSVTISIRNGGMEVFQFATNRILSTIIGVLISLYVNTFPHFKTKNKKILFLSSVDNALLDKDSALTPFCKYKLNDLVNNDCSLTFMTTRALTSLAKIFDGVNMKLPIIVMNGCAIYHPDTKDYSSIKGITNNQREELEDVFNSLNINYFTYLINEGVLNCYYSSIKEAGSKIYYEQRKNGPYYSFSQAIAPKELDILQYVIIEKDDVVESIIEKVNKTKNIDKFNIISYPFDGLDGYSFLKINIKDACKENSIDSIKEDKEYDYIICVGSGRTDINMMRKADYSVCLNSAPDYIKQEAKYIIDSDKPDDLVRFIDKVFRTKNYKEYLKKIEQ